MLTHKMLKFPSYLIRYCDKNVKLTKYNSRVLLYKHS